MCPLSVLPSPQAPHPTLLALPSSGGPRLKFGGKGGLRAPWREGLPPKPLAKERPNKLGGTRPRQGPSLAGRQSDGDSSRRPGSALGNPPPLIPLPTNKWEGEAAVQCLQSNRWLTMSSHETHVAAHRKPVLFAIVYLAGKRTGHGGQTRAAAPRANGPAGSKEAANCAAGEIARPLETIMSYESS